jgi:D-alanyl-D-alanine carboxypeptidase (penicillin-binding protein 5/6)
MYVTIPRGRYEALTASMKLPTQLIAPIDKHAPVGEVTVSFQGENVSSMPLVSLHPVTEAGLWTRLVDGVMRWLE